MRLPIFFLGLLLWLPALAQVYRWTDADGVVHYGDKGPTPDAKPVQLPPLQLISSGITPLPGTGAASGTASVGTLPTSAAMSLSVLSPAPDQVFRNTDRTLAVTVALQQPLPEGAGLVYLLDGNARNSKPVQSLNYSIKDVDRGSHLLSVAAVDSQGRELGRAPPVLVHLQPPGLK